MCFEPMAVAEDAQDVLLLSSHIGGAAAHQQEVHERSAEVTMVARMTHEWHACKRWQIAVSFTLWYVFHCTKARALIGRVGLKRHASSYITKAG